MSDRLEPPERYERNYRSADIDSLLSKDKNEAATVIRPKKSFSSIRKGDIFIAGAFDVPFFALTMVILAIGLVMLFSASYPYSYYKYDNSYHYFLRQLIFAAVGVVAMLIISKINFNVFKAFQPIILVVSLALLCIVLVYHTDLSSEAGESFKRYIKIPGTSLTFQPSDIAKFALILTLAAYISKKADKMHTIKDGFFIPALIICVFCVLIVLENHVSGTILMFLIGIAMMYAGGTKKWLFAVGIAVVAAGMFVAVTNPDILPEYVTDKIEAWLDKDTDPLGTRWQVNNSLYAIGSGSLFGVGLGNSKQKYLYVSEPQNDFIFSIVCEELGFVGAAIIILLFAALVVRGILIALRTTDKYASLTVIGIITQVGVQVALNILVVTDSIPNTGIALPFFSYGGTALLMLFIEMGVVLAVSRKSNQKKV
ncbi:MAG: putative lipid II flippase FtsW [Clostridiales bacterium]|nr:putative lipid II flippase FtsW [Clostridiales bacterium]